MENESNRNFVSINRPVHWGLGIRTGSGVSVSEQNRGLGIQTKQGSRYPNKKGKSSHTETLSPCSDKDEGLDIRIDVFGYRDP